MPLQNDKNIYEPGFSESYSLTKYKYVVEYKDKYNENSIWERCIAQHDTLSGCKQEYASMKRAGLWKLRIIKVEITETILYED